MHFPLWNWSHQLFPLLALTISSSCLRVGSGEPSCSVQEPSADWRRQAPFNTDLHGRKLIHWWRCCCAVRMGTESPCMQKCFWATSCNSLFLVAQLVLLCFYKVSLQTHLIPLLNILYSIVFKLYHGHTLMRHMGPVHDRSVIFCFLSVTPLLPTSCSSRPHLPTLHRPRL